MKFSWDKAKEFAGAIALTAVGVVVGLAAYNQVPKLWSRYNLPKFGKTSAPPTPPAGDKTV